MLVVVGENPDELVKKYDKKLKVEPYVVYQFKDAKKLHEKYIKILQGVLETMDKCNPEYLYTEGQLNSLENESDVDFFLELSEDLDIDDETGDAYTTKNPYGRYDGCSIGKHFALPLINKRGEEVYSCRKGDVDWSVVHLSNQYVYEFAWDSVMEGKKPKDESEKVIYENMKNRKEYFRHYGTRENYVFSNTSFWGYAFLSDKVEWTELEDTENQFEWVKNFYGKFIEPLGNNEKISIFECIRN